MEKCYIIPKNKQGSGIAQENKLAIFEEKEIRREWYKEDWYFSVIDVVEALTENNKRPRKYWSDLKQKLISEGFVEVSEKIGQVKMMAKDGKITGKARKEIEEKIGKKVAEKTNYNNLTRKLRS